MWFTRTPSRISVRACNWKTHRTTCGSRRCYWWTGSQPKYQTMTIFRLLSDGALSLTSSFPLSSLVRRSKTLHSTSSRRCMRVSSRSFRIGGMGPWYKTCRLLLLSFDSRCWGAHGWSGIQVGGRALRAIDRHAHVSRKLEEGNENTGKKIKVPRLVWMHSDEMEVRI